VRLTNTRALMGSFANRPVTMILAWSLTGLLVVLNAVLLLQSI
jgi:Mn2+/Fe2+ NRAMP family transporter